MSTQKTYLFDDIFKFLNETYVADFITYEDLRQRTIYLFENNILKNRFETLAQNQILSLKKIKTEIKLLKQECVDLEKLIQTNPYESLQKRLNDLLERLQRALETYEQEKIDGFQNLRKTNSLRRTLLKELESDYALAVNLKVNDVEKLDQIRIELFGNLLDKK